MLAKSTPGFKAFPLKEMPKVDFSIPLAWEGGGGGGRRVEAPGCVGVPHLVKPVEREGDTFIG
jgi:hypothetical protein